MTRDELTSAALLAAADWAQGWAPEANTPYDVLLEIRRELHYRTRGHRCAWCFVEYEPADELDDAYRAVLDATDLEVDELRNLTWPR